MKKRVLLVAFLWFNSLYAQADITAVEYFIDQDPGVGQANAVSINPGQDITADFNVDLNNVDDGFHTLFVRAKDANGLWSLAKTQPFLKQSVAALDNGPDVIVVEYFIDQDPGPGLANAISFIPEQDVTTEFNVGLNGIDNGFHTLFVRTQDASGHRSITNARPFLKEAISAADAAPDIVAIDYYFVDNTDTTLTPITTYDDFGASADLETEFALNLVGLDGDYTAFVAARDQFGRSSQAITHQLSVEFDSSAPVEEPTMELPETQESDGTVVLDFDLASGDQGVRHLTVTRPDQEILAQVILGQTFSEFKQVLAIITFDSTQMTPTFNEPVGIFANAFRLRPLAKGDSASFGAALVRASAPLTGAGEVLEVGFLPTSNFAGSTVLELVEFFIGPSATELQVLNPGTTVVVSDTFLDGDMNGDDRVDFADFSIFEPFFGTKDSSADFDGNGQVDFRDFFILASNFDPASVGKLVALAHQRLGLPATPHLEQNYPNPFNSDTVIGFTLPTRSTVELDIYNLAGQRVATLIHQVLEAGIHTAPWNGRNSSDQPLASGTYLYRLQVDGTDADAAYAEVRKLALLR